MLNLLSAHKTVRQSTEGALGIDAPTAIGGNVKQHVKKLNALPRKVSQESYLREKEITEREKSATMLLKKVVDLRKQRMDTAVQQHATIAQHRGHVMDAAEKIAGVDADFASKVMLHGLTLGEQEATVNGMQRAFHGARTLVRG